ncbi:MAG: type II toxin-antitoxin system VapB family antitoxin [Deltaproteobacteria bacterium]|nr:type II toxin-antitoxin system VapB family antitoxin [Deltaproteobacteria bacterium]
MRTTLNLNEELVRKATKVTGIEEKTRLIQMGLQALIENAALKRLSQLHGAIKKARAPRRWRF